MRSSGCVPHPADRKRSAMRKYMKRAWVLIPLLLALLVGYGYQAGWFSKEIEHSQNIYGSNKTDVPWFEVQVKLSAQARETLRKRGETIIVAAYFMGVPKPHSKCPLSIGGNISLGESQYELPNEGIVRFDLLNVSEERVNDLINPDFGLSLQKRLIVVSHTERGG